MANSGSEPGFAIICVQLETDYRQKNVLLYDLTFWAVEFLALVENLNACGYNGEKAPYMPVLYKSVLTV